MDPDAVQTTAELERRLRQLQIVEEQLRWAPRVGVDNATFWRGIGRTAYEATIVELNGRLDSLQRSVAEAITSTLADLVRGRALG